MTFDQVKTSKISSISPSLSPKCLVCGEDGAAKHYGSYCCSGCKGFFRRTARFQRVYICPFENNCNIQKEFRNACRSCRYSKCLSVGLNPLLVHSDRGIIGTQKCRKHKDSSSFLPDLPLSPLSDDSTMPSTSSPPETKLQLKKFIKSRDPKKITISWKIPFQIHNDDICLPLGQLNLLSTTPQNNAENMWNYFATIEKIIDNYNDTDIESHISENFSVKLDITATQACESPKLICKRTKLDWSSKIYVSSNNFKNIWARSVLSYFDWVSFIPELKEFNIPDRNMLIVGRSMQSLWTTFTHKSAVNNAPGILLPGGCYFPRDKEEWKKMDPNIIMSCSRISDMVNYEIIDEMKSLSMTDEEFAILKVLCFFTAVPQLSKEGYEIVQQAKRKYANILTELIRTKHSNKPFTEIIERVNRFMLLLPGIEIYENIKVLSYIFPPILIYTSIAPFGLVITLISTNIFSYYTPYCTFHIFYNLSFLIVIVHQICVKTSTPVISKNVTSTVINPFGKNLPANVTSEKYFEDLQKQWQ